MSDPNVIIIAQTQLNQQQVIDGLPQYTIYQCVGLPDLPGPRSPGTSRYANGKDWTYEGYPAASSYDPAVPPMASGAEGQVCPGLVRGHRYNPPAPKPQLEPAVYVPGTGWVTSANPNG